MNPTEEIANNCTFGQVAFDDPNRCHKRDHLLGPNFDTWFCAKLAGHSKGNGGEFCSCHMDCGADNANGVICGFAPDHDGPHSWVRGEVAIPDTPAASVKIGSAICPGCV